MISFLPLCSHPSPKRVRLSETVLYHSFIYFILYFSSCSIILSTFVLQVLIVGGGDGGVAREVAKHPDVEKIDQVEIDAQVIEVSKKFLPSMAVGFSHPKLSLHVEDGFKFMQQHEQEFDVVITDSSDPVGKASRSNLYES